jgi:hypothetical protein
LLSILECGKEIQQVLSILGYLEKRLEFLWCVDWAQN